ncbi:MAG: TetR family transcriptional regulator [Actinobacteria bacterium]|nr:TetR family transcriptional regulator [Thermoleophilia bacterium]MCB9011710.1 TetR family transcriptional regulator [Actinomycetota bacterium]
MPPNLERRTALCDAGIRLLAREGGRGLTHRAIDAEAGVPTGTASNYFRSRDAILEAIALRLMERLTPRPGGNVPSADAAPTREDQIRAIRHVVAAALASPDLYLAMLELRLEAVRRPSLRDALTQTIRRNFENDYMYHLAAGLPGGRTEVMLLHLTIDGLLLDQLTLPNAIGVDDPAALVGRIVDLIVMPAPSAPIDALREAAATADE